MRRQQVTARRAADAAVASMAASTRAGRARARATARRRAIMAAAGCEAAAA
jgi:hypothetical protein